MAKTNLLYNFMIVKVNHKKIFTSQTMSLPLNRFDFSSFTPLPAEVRILIGRRDTGKSFIVRDLQQQQRQNRQQELPQDRQDISDIRKNQLRLN
jgi:hypothetical protein